MWESPIKIIYTDMKTQMEEGVMKAVQNVGINVDRYELLRALQYDRDQYEKGFRDGRKDRDDEIVRCKDCAKNSFTKCPMAIGWQSDYDYCSRGERKESE